MNLSNDPVRVVDRGDRRARVRRWRLLHDVIGFVQIRVPATPVPGHVWVVDVLVAVGRGAENASLADGRQVHRRRHRVSVRLEHLRLRIPLFRRLVFRHLDDDAIFGDCFGVGQSPFERVSVANAALDIEFRMSGHDVATNQWSSHLAIASGTFVQPFADSQISGIRFGDNSERRFGGDDNSPRSQLIDLVLRFLVFLSVMFSQAVASSRPRTVYFDAFFDGSFRLGGNYY